MPATRGKASASKGKAAKKTPVTKAVTKKPAAAKNPAASGGSGSPWDDEMSSIPKGAVYIEACKS